MKGPRPMLEGAHIAPWTLLPPKPGTCQECAREHKPDLPHDQQSLFWQYKFFERNGRWPTWADAMAHCTPLMKQRWIKELAALGVTVPQGEQNRRERGAK